MKYIFLLIACVFALSGNAQKFNKKVRTLKVKKRIEYKERASGTIVDAATGSPLNGVRVAVPGLSTAMTDESGKFSIRIPSYEVELLVSSPGYQQKRIPLRGEKEVTVRLYDETHKSLFEDVLTPLGDMAGSQTTTALTQLNGDNSLSPATSPEALLQGTVPGLNTLFRSGMENAGANMFMGGFNSIYTNNQPLLIIDGMVVENLSAGISLIDGYLSTPMSTIDVKDIERITVLKDAATLYGVKGSNGAIVIETKRAKDAETRITAQITTGMNLKPSSIPMLDAVQSKRYLMDVYQSRGYSAGDIQKLPFINDTKPEQHSWGYEGNADYYRYNKNTDWQDQLFVQGFKQNYSIGVMGGDDVALYALSLGYLQNEGLVKGTDFSRFSARINTDINFSPKFTVQTNMNFVYGKKNLMQEGNASPQNPIYASLVKSPFMAGFTYNEQDQLSPNYEEVDLFGMSNPTAIVDNMLQENISYGFFANIHLKYKIWKELTLSTRFGLRLNKEKERIFRPEEGIPYEDVATSEVTNQMQYRTERIFSLFDETRANYLFKLGVEHQLDATLGMRYFNSRSEDDWGKSYNSTSDRFRSLQYGLNDLRQMGGSIGTWNWLSFYGNVAYSLKNRYFVNATLSADASSRYGEDIGQFQIFPALSAAWVVSSENFMRQLSWVDLLKIRAGYSMSGNDDIGNYAARRYYSSQNLLGNYGLVRGNLVNKNLKPERMARLNAGMDVAVLNERLSLSVDVYRSTIKDMIAYSPITSYSGFSTYIDNSGEMRNTGVDVAINARVLNLPSLKWDLGATVSHYKNKITELKGNSYLTDIADGTILTEVGRPMGVFYGYKTNGIYATTEDAKADGLQVRSGLADVPFGAGDVRFVNMNGDKYINEEDMTVIGDPNPDIYGGLNTRILWKNFTFSARFTYSLGNDVYNYTRRTLESMSGLENQMQAVLNRWRAEGQVTSMPKVTYGDPMGNARFSDRWIEDGSYLKFKNLTVAYDVPIKKGIITGIQVYAVAENICTWTKYKGYDPEFSASTNPLGYGIDAFMTPQARTFYVGLKLGL